MAIARRARQRTALHVAVDMAATAVTAATDRIRPRPTPRRGAAAALPATAEGRVGRE